MGSLKEAVRPGDFPETILPAKQQHAYCGLCDRWRLCKLYVLHSQEAAWVCAECLE